MNMVFIENIFSTLETKNGVPPCGVYAIFLNVLLCSVVHSVNAGVEGIAPPLEAKRAHCLYCVSKGRIIFLNATRRAALRNITLTLRLVRIFVPITILKILYYLYT